MIIIYPTSNKVNEYKTEYNKIRRNKVAGRLYLSEQTFSADFSLVCPSATEQFPII